MMTPDEMIAVIQAHKEGKIVERLCHCGCNGDWKQFNPLNDTLGTENQEWRIKPEPKKPREWWIARRPGYSDNLFESEIGMHKHFEIVNKGCHCRELIHVREVLPEETR